MNQYEREYELKVELTQNLRYDPDLSDFICISYNALEPWDFSGTYIQLKTVWRM